MEELKELYFSNKDFNNYVSKYCAKEEIDLLTALTHASVKNYADYLTERGQGETKLSNMWGSAGAAHENMADI